jgi:hypothetical protein
MAILDRTQLKALINAIITTNGNNEITGATLNNVLQNIVDSLANLITDNSALGLYEFDTTKEYSVGELTWFNGNFYICRVTSTGAFSDANFIKLTNLTPQSDFNITFPVFDINTIYLSGDGVRYNNEYYIANDDVNEEVPDASAKWDKVYAHNGDRNREWVVGYYLQGQIIRVGNASYVFTQNTDLGAFYETSSPETAPARWKRFNLHPSMEGTENNTIRYGADGQAVESGALQNDGTDITIKNTLIIEGDTDAALFTEGAGATEKFIIKYDKSDIPFIVFDKATFDFLVKDGDGLSNLLTIRDKGEYSEVKANNGKLHISDDYGGVLLVSDPTLTEEGSGSFIVLSQDGFSLGRNFQTNGEFGFEFGNFNKLGNNRVYLDHALDDGVSSENVLESQRDNISGVQLNTYGAKDADIHTFKGVSKAAVQPDTLVDFDAESYTTKKYVDTRSTQVLQVNQFIQATNTTYTPSVTLLTVNNGKFILDADKYEIEKIVFNVRSNTTDTFKVRLIEPPFNTVFEKTDYAVAVADGTQEIFTINGADIALTVTGSNVMLLQIGNTTGATQTTTLLTFQVYLKVK